jgi:hypothetical protein
VMQKGLDATLDEVLHSDNPDARAAAIYLLGALDDLPRLATAVGTAHQHDVWDNGVLALRHWIGRAPGQDLKLYNALIERRHFPPEQAQMVLQLLHSFSAAQLARPETYETLIDLLDHDRLAIRGLAYWHLYRLVPSGRELGYDPLADKAARGKAIEAWKKLIPAGQLPPKANSPGT